MIFGSFAEEAGKRIKTEEDMWETGGKKKWRICWFLTLHRGRQEETKEVIVKLENIVIQQSSSIKSRILETRKKFSILINTTELASPLCRTSASSGNEDYQFWLNLFT